MIMIMLCCSLLSLVILLFVFFLLPMSSSARMLLLLSVPFIFVPFFHVLFLFFLFVCLFSFLPLFLSEYSTALSCQGELEPAMRFLQLAVPHPNIDCPPDDGSLLVTTFGRIKAAALPHPVCTHNTLSLVPACTCSICRSFIHSFIHWFIPPFVHSLTFFLQFCFLNHFIMMLSRISFSFILSHTLLEREHSGEERGSRHQLKVEKLDCADNQLQNSFL